MGWGWALSLFCDQVLSALSSLAIISLMEGDLVALL